MARALKATVVIALIMTVLFIWSVAWAETKTVQSKTATVITSKVLVTKNPKIVTLQQPVSSKYVVAPKPLTREVKQAYAREILLALGVKKVELPPQVTKVRLTPDAPRSGFNWYEVHVGYNYPFPRNDRAAYTYIGPMRKVPSGEWSSVLLHFERTVPGKFYLLDIAAGSPTPDKIICKLNGAIEGNVNLQDGHFVAGFVANRAVSEIMLKSRRSDHKNGEILIYSIELTQVD